MDLTKDILDEFKKITGTDVGLFFSNAIAFFTVDYNRIVAYYSGSRVVVDKGVFDNFDNLRKDCSNIFAIFHSLNKSLNNLKWWTVLEFVEQIDSRLNTLEVINKWSRSSLKNVGYSPFYQVDYLTKQNQTLERVVKDILNDEDQDDWYDLAISNNLREEDYTLSGGTDLKLNLPIINNGIQVDSVVAVMVGKAIYGNDVYKKIQFDTVNNDLTVLNYDDTIVQSVNILAFLKMNDNPAAPNDGLQREVAVGGTRAIMNFPVIQRQMAATFATDDTLKNFTITSMSVDQDGLLINFEVTTRLNEIVPNNQILV